MWTSESSSYLICNLCELHEKEQYFTNKPDTIIGSCGTQNQVGEAKIDIPIRQNCA